MADRENWVVIRYFYYWEDELGRLVDMVKYYALPKGKRDGELSFSGEAIIGRFTRKEAEAMMKLLNASETN
jgi:hypothetical protein